MNKTIPTPPQLQPGGSLNPTSGIPKAPLNNKSAPAPATLTERKQNNAEACALARALRGTPPYDPAKAYPYGAVVARNGRIYRRRPCGPARVVNADPAENSDDCRALWVQVMPGNDTGAAQGVAAVAVRVPTLTARRFPRRDRRLSYPVTPQTFGDLPAPPPVFTGEPRTLLERLRRSFTAWVLLREAPERRCTAPLRQRRTRAAYRERLARILRGHKPFQRPRRRRKRDRATYWTPDEAGFYGRPRTGKEARRRAGDAMGLISALHSEGWQLLGLAFALGSRPDDDPEVVAYTRRSAWNERNARRLRRVYAGLPPFREPQGDDRARYALICRFVLGDPKGTYY